MGIAVMFTLPYIKADEVSDECATPRPTPIITFTFTHTAQAEEQTNDCYGMPIFYGPCGDLFEYYSNLLEDEHATDEQIAQAEKLLEECYKKAYPQPVVPPKVSPTPGPAPRI